MYRFALYGRSECGKTCLLATLAMGAEGHPRGLTVERIPVAETSEHQDSDGDRELKALQSGRNWIDAAIAQLRKGSVPEGNPPLFDGSGMTVDFNIGSPRRSPIAVRTVDYSGELIKPDEEDRMDNAASLLRDFLTQYDGFLILAETPRKDSSSDHLSDNLRHLREAFVSLRRSGGHTETPVAVVFTKWDRQHALVADSPDVETRHLRDFLKSHPAHASLVQSISNALTDSAMAAPGTEREESATYSDSEWTNGEAPPERQSNETPGPAGMGPVGGLQHENCAIFPASAFGRAERDGAVERPTGTHPPFGLLEPFLWLADRRDAIDVEYLKRDYLRVPGIYYWAHPGELSGLRTRSRMLTHQVASSTKAGRQLSELDSRLAGKWWRQILTYALSPFVVCGVLWLLVCRYEFQATEAVVRNPQTSEAQLLAARDWFNEHRLKPWPMWGLDSPSTAKALADEVDDRIEELYSRRIEQASTDEQMYLAARQYTERLPNGRHIDAARETVDTTDIRNAQTENDEWLAGRVADWERAGKVEAELKQLSETLAAGLPHPDESTPEQRKRLTGLTDSVAQQLGVVMRRKQWEDFLVRIDSLVSTLQLRPAAQSLVTWDPHDGNWRTVVDGFPGRIRERVRQEVDRRLRNASFESATNLILEAGEAYQLLESALRKEQPEAADRLQAARHELAPLKKRVELLHDRDLYDRVRRLKSTSVCRRYLDGAPVGSMRNQVNVFSRWLIACTKPLNVKVAVHIFWSKKYGNVSGSEEDDHKLKVTIGDKVVLVKGSLTGSPGKLSGEVGKFLVKGLTLNHKLKIHAGLTEIDTFFDDDIGSGQFTIRLSELRAGKTLVVTPADGSAYDNEVRFKITDGVPVEPELPPWKNPSSSR